MNSTILRAGLVALMVGAIAGCGGGGGGGGDAGGGAAPPPAAGPTVAAAPVPPGNSPISVGGLTTDQFVALDPQVVLGAAIVGSPPQVSFALQDKNGNPIIGFGGKSSVATTPNGRRYNNISFAIAKLVPGTAATGAGTTRSKWVSYMVVTTTKNATSGALTQTLGRPGTENVGELIDNGNGTYVYKFYRDITQVTQLVADATTTSNKADLGDLTYDANAVHRLTIQFSGAAPGTGTNTADGSPGPTAVNMVNPVNVVYDFIPATGKAVTATDPARDVVATANCNECHTKLNKFALNWELDPDSGDKEPEYLHGGNRYETKYCVVCHTEQRKFGRADSTVTVEATNEVKLSGNTYRLGAGDATTQISNGDTGGEALGNFPNLVHKIHNGHALSKTGYNYAGVEFNKIGFSMLDEGQRMCLKCHKENGGNAKQGENWNAVPSKLACGGCHDGINFTTGLGQTLANAAAADQVGETYTVSNHEGGAIENEAACAICHTANSIKVVHRTVNKTTHNPTLATGLVHFTYEIASADVDAGTNELTIKFAIKKDGTAITFGGTGATNANPLVGYTGAPSFLLPFAVAQGGITTPADYNNIGATGVTVGNGQPRSVSIGGNTGLYAGGQLGAPDANGYHTVKIANAYPAGAKMRAVVLQGYFTQAAGTGGIGTSTARHAISVVRTVTGDTQRRQVVEGAKCGNCHEWFEGHGGNRVIGKETQGELVCLACHNPNISTSGRRITDAELTGTFAAANGRSTSKSYVDLLTRPAWQAFMTAWTGGEANAGLKLPVTSNNFKDMIHQIHAGKKRLAPFADARYFNGNLTLVDASNIAFPGIINRCETCHIAGTYGAPVAGTLPSTYEANNGNVTAPADVQASLATVPNATDKVTSPWAAACTNCHDISAAEAHMGGVGGVGGNGGQIRVARGALVQGAETCAFCHGSGKDYDVSKVHSK